MRSVGYESKSIINSMYQNRYIADNCTSYKCYLPNKFAITNKSSHQCIFWHKCLKLVVLLSLLSYPKACGIIYYACAQIWRRILLRLNAHFEKTLEGILSRFRHPDLLRTFKTLALHDQMRLVSFCWSHFAGLPL